MQAQATHKSEWGFVCGRVSACEGRFLSHDFFLTLASHTQLEDVLRQLNDTPLREYVTPGADWEDWSAVIDRYFHAEAMSIRDDCPQPEVADFFLLREDYQNLKRAVLGNREFPFAALYLSEEQLAKVAGGDASALPAPFKEAAVRAIEVHETTQDDSLVDIVLDGAYLRHLQLLAKIVNNAIITEYNDKNVLLRAVVALWREHRSGQNLKRFEQYVLPLGDLTATVQALIDTGDPKKWGEILTGRLGDLYREAMASGEMDGAARFDDLVRNHLIDVASRGYGQVAGPARVFAYLRALASETHNLKLVVCGKLSRIDATLLKQRLRRRDA